MMRIAEANPMDRGLFERILSVQFDSYKVESELIDYPNFPPLWQTVEQLQESGEKFLVCLLDEEVVGATSYSLESDAADICRLVVSPRHFGKKIGTQLVLRVEEHLAPPIRRITVSTAWKNTPAIRLYEKCGYSISKRWFLPDGLELVGLEKKITS